MELYQIFKKNNVYIILQINLKLTPLGLPKRSVNEIRVPSREIKLRNHQMIHPIQFN